MGAVVLKDSERCPYLSSLPLGTKAVRPACAFSQGYQNCRIFLKIREKISKPGLSKLHGYH